MITTLFGNGTDDFSRGRNWCLQCLRSDISIGEIKGHIYTSLEFHRFNDFDKGVEEILRTVASRL